MTPVEHPQHSPSRSATARAMVVRDMTSLLRRWSWRRRRHLAHALRRVALDMRHKRARNRQPRSPRRLALWARPARMRADRLLLGEDNEMPAVDVARATGELLHPSLALPQWPIVRAALGEDMTQLEALAQGQIESRGDYYGCRSLQDLRRMLTDLPHVTGPVHVRRVQKSDCAMVVAGHLAAAGAHLRGQDPIDVVVERTRTWTPLQEMLRTMSWLGGRLELYQPIDAPEVDNANWPLVRRSTDRFAMMREFLAERNLLPPETATFMDVGASYGWFLAQMEQLGFEVRGLDMDPVARELAAGAFGIRPDRYVVADCAAELLRSPTVDVVSCLSVAHHFVLSRGSCSIDEFRDRLARVTGRVLFFDTGEAHEAWIGDSVPEWTPEYIAKWLATDTDFDEVIPLGVDQDDTGAFAGNYGRTLFACIRNEANTTTSDRLLRRRQSAVGPNTAVAIVNVVWAAWPGHRHARTPSKRAPAVPHWSTT